MFVHLRLHTEFSVVDGTNRIDEIAAAAAADSQPALAISDLSNLFGTVKFYKAARSAGVKPLIAADVWVQVPGKDSSAPPARLLLIAGTPLDEPIAQHGPFVMNTRDEIMQAVADYQAGKFAA